MDATRLSLRYAALSDVGRARKDNQDSGYASPNLLAIADGVGGAARGDLASSTAVQILRRLDEPDLPDMHEGLAGAIHRIHDRLAELVEEDAELDGTSTTVTAALFDGTKITVGHVGDSRGYLLRDGTLSQLTKDHTFVQSLIDEGRISEEEALTHPHKNLILRAVDGVRETEPDLFDVEVAAGDRIMLCSDGCSGVLDSNRIADILGTGNVDYAAVELVRAALDAGSNDNVTVVVADVVSPESAAAADDPESEEAAAATTGPMLVGAAAEQARKPGTGGPGFRGHRSGDTGEMDPVPGAGTDDPEALRYAPRAPRRFAWARRLVVLGVLAALIVLAGLWSYDWSQRQYYVAVAADDGEEMVAIYRGIQSELPGVELNRVAEMTDIPIESLPDFRAAQVRSGIAADDLASAEEIVQSIRTDFARKCPEPSPSPSPVESPSPTQDRDRQGDANRGERSSPSGTPSPTGGSPSPTASPSTSLSPTLAPPQCIEASATAGGAS